MNPMDPPLVSVLMPVYNAQGTVEEAIESVLAESDVPLEVIVVDDASTDGSLSLIEGVARRDARVHVLHRDENGGDGPTRNTGLAHVGGEWLILLDADDILVEGALARLAPLLRQTTADVVFTHYAELDVRRGRRWRRYDKKLDEYVGMGPMDPRTIGDEYFVRIHALISNKVFRMDSVTSLGMTFQDNPRNGDILFTLGMPALATSVEFTDVELYEYRVNQPSSLTTNADRLPLTDAAALVATHDLLVERELWDTWRIPFLNWAVRYLVTVLSSFRTYDGYLSLATVLRERVFPHIDLDKTDLSELCPTGQYGVCRTLLEDGPDAALFALMRLMNSWRENNASDRDQARRNGYERSKLLEGRLATLSTRAQSAEKDLRLATKRRTELERALLESEGRAAELEDRVAGLEHDLDATWNSASMRIGRVATYAPRTIRDLLTRRGDR